MKIFGEFVKFWLKRNFPLLHLPFKLLLLHRFQGNLYPQFQWRMAAITINVGSYFRVIFSRYTTFIQKIFYILRIPKYPNRSTTFPRLTVITIQDFLLKFVNVLLYTRIIGMS
ncbi:MAG: hypothetical protein A3A86_01220 [Elusimicrobia bacterium RIFCSPLOWO2_01_FULL_60_11]|nr:MAG: hypothetical protein A3A86_01220 [Elusimicrobia bacterium RIFCSPLOWO2_01_FULL_60_11]